MTPTSRPVAGLTSFLVTALAAVSVAAPSAATGTRAQDPGPTGPEARFERVTTTSANISRTVDPNAGPTTVMVQVAGDPIALVEADAGHRVSNQRRGAIRSDLRSTQRGVAARVRALGGEVGTSYQAAYNGIRVTIESREIAQLRSIPGVIGVHELAQASRANVNGVPLVGAPQVWAGVNGFAGEGIKVAIIDSGIDYTHADFGGPGTSEAFDADTDHTDVPDPALVGPGASRVKGGVDLVGDDYNANWRSPTYQPVPHPDPDPLDCITNGHGTHVAGTAAGSGVLADGSTYTGPYDATTISSHSWRVAPGVAPMADLYAVRVFGCEGTTDAVVDAIEWAVVNDMDVINMSLGSTSGGADAPDAVAADNAAAAGIVVVAVSGNHGPEPYMTSSPASGSGVISVAANDPAPGFAGVDVSTAAGTVQAINANGIAVDGLSAPLKVLRDGGGDISLGCDPQEYVDQHVSGTIVVTQRGSCARVARAIFAQHAGAAAVIMVNNADSLPPFEGPITQNPDDGTPFTVTIPFLGVRSGDGSTLDSADGSTANLDDVAIPNPDYLVTPIWSAPGPRTGDGALKPDITAPGWGISSAAVGTGSVARSDSGTSMASPHVAGAAALVRQAHPSWGLVKYWKAALVNSADPGLVANYSTRVNGAGFLQVQKAVRTQVVATSVDDTATLSYKYLETATNLNQARIVRLRNFGTKAVTFTVGHAREAGSPHSVSTSARTIRVPAGGQASLSVSLRVPVKTIGDSTGFRDVSGLLTLTPQNGANNGVSLSVPYYLVPRAVSNLRVELNTTVLKNKGAAPAHLTNQFSSIHGHADWYAWGISDPIEPDLGSNDVRAVGVQTFPDDELLVFGISTHKRWSNARTNEFQVYVDVDGDDAPDYKVVASDIGGVTVGVQDGRVGTFVFDLRTGDGNMVFLADAPTDSTTMALPVLYDQLCNPGSPCLSPGQPITYYAWTADLSTFSFDEPESDATFDVFHPSVSTGMFNTVPASKRVTQQVILDKARFAATPTLGLMVMTHDNSSGKEAALLRIP